jgi:hypothetical protein
MAVDQQSRATTAGVLVLPGFREMSAVLARGIPAAQGE